LKRKNKVNSYKLINKGKWGNLLFFWQPPNTLQLQAPTQLFFFPEGFKVKRACTDKFFLGQVVWQSLERAFFYILWSLISLDPFIIHFFFLIWVFFDFGVHIQLFVGLAYQGKKEIVFIFIIEYSSLIRDFGPLGLFLHEDSWKVIFWLVLELEISYRVIIIILWRILVFF